MTRASEQENRPVGLQVAGNDHRLHALDLDPRRCGDLGVTEAVEGEGRGKHVRTLPRQDVAVGGAGVAQQGCRQGARGIEHLGVAGGYLRAGRAARPDLEKAGEVLTRVEPHGRRLAAPSGDLQPAALEDPDGRHGPRLQMPGQGKLGHRLPRGIVEAGRPPADGLGAKVDLGCAVVELGRTWTSP